MMPVVFVSHGAPDALLQAPDTVACWREIARELPQPKAILVVSAHWQARQATASLAGAPETIHDFSGFAPELHRMHYRAPGAPSLAERAVALLATAGIAADLHPDRGLDHGAWAPLSVMYADARVPVTQLSLVRHADAANHYAIGQALAPLRDEGVLIIASGSITHNFAWLAPNATADQPPLPQAKAFADWVAERIAANDTAALLDYRSAPHGADAHPSDEHLLPLFVALGAARSELPQRYRPRFTYGALAMDAYVWRDAAAIAQPALAA
jgi:4,5-DOPA dioxygenase extradiol